MKVAKMKARGKPGPVRKPGPAPARKLTIKSLPLPAYERILLYVASNFKAVQDFALVCKKFAEVAKGSKQHWFQMSVMHFHPVLAKTHDVEALQSLLREDRVEPSVNWQSFFMTQRQAQIDRKRKSTMTKFGRVFTTNNEESEYYRTRWEPIGCSFVLGTGKNVSVVPAQNVVFFATGLTVTVELPEQPKKIPPLTATSQGEKAEFQCGKTAILCPGDISLQESNGVLSCVYTSGEVCFLSWNLNYFTLAQRLTSFSYPSKEDDLDSQFGLRGYYLLIEVRNCTESYEVLALRNVDLKAAGNVAVASVDCTNRFRPLPMEIGYAWKTTAFSNRFPGVCVVDTLLRSEFGDIVWSGCRGAKIRPQPSKARFDGEVFTLSCEDDRGSVTLTLHKTDSGYDICKAAVSVKLSEIEKLYRRAA